MRKKYLSFFAVVLGINGFFSPVASAHCPLCTIGAGAVALGALWLGVSAFSIGVFLGAFAMALGLWIGGMIRKQYVPHQRLAIGLISFLTTILPLKPLFYDNAAVLISLSGDYGTWLNTTYLIDRFLVGGVLGALIVAWSPAASRFVSALKGRRLIPYQGIVITFAFLLIASVLYEIFA